MTPQAERLLEEALQLPEDSRVKLAAALLDSLDEPADPPREVESSWSAAIDRRMREVQSGQVRPVPWEEARRMILGDEAGESSISTRKP
jgi:putative addiction module component (TIGR02574 family)